TTTPGRGFVSFKEDHAEFDETSAELTYSSGPLTLMYGRGENLWGRGKRGTLGMSGYSAPYDMIRLETEFWRLRYVFTAAEIEQYPPVAQFYYNPPAGIYADSVAVAKRFAAHRLEFDLTDRLNLGFYETVIYGGRWDLSYLNPLMFLRGAEHANGDHDNAALGADFRLFVHRSHSIYGELFIDDITTTKLGTDWYGNKLAWKLGTFFVEPLGLGDTDFRMEYTRIQPWVYGHRYPINVYDHYGSTLGHPAGPNSDELYTEIRKRFSRRFNVSVYGIRSRHGANPPGRNVGGDIKLGFRNGDSTRAKFLDGILEKRTAAGFDVSYELLWQLIMKAGYTYEDRDGKGNNIFRFSFGLNE
ncbi:MAG: capsule assembly Wzi family protein, partial [Candidatus Latescibacterota bacterium]